MKKRKTPLYLILLPLYFILFLYTANINELKFSDLIHPIIVSLVMVGLLYGILFAALRNVDRAALLTFVIWVIFSLYGHLYGILRDLSTPLNYLGKHSVLVTLTLVVLVALIVLIVRSKKSFSTLNRWISIVLTVLMIFELASMVIYYIGKDDTASISSTRIVPVVPLDKTKIQTKPDIYYIILDTYSRDDVIRKYIGIDTTSFLDSLRQEGFYIAECSTSNNDFTEVSLASSLNMDFVQNLDPTFVPENESNATLADYILHNKVRATLESIGYKTVAFSTGFYFTEMTDVDEYLAPPTKPALNLEIQPFDTLWLKTTALRALFDIHPPVLSPWLNELTFPHNAHVEREEYLLDKLPQLASEPGPKFVFAHVIIPHVPFVFRADGSVTKDYHYFGEVFDQPMSTEYLIDGYKNQVEYINQRILLIVDEIIRNSAQPPIIIIQGDHGLQYYDRFPILNAYYLPDGGNEELYPTITPINSFAVIFNKYFDAQLPLLPDIAYTSTYTRPYDLQEVTAIPCPVK